MNSLFRLLTIVTGIWVMPFIPANSQTIRDVGFTVSTDETSLNRLISNNYNQSKFPKVYNGTYNGAPFKVEFLKKPVSAIQSDVKMEFRLKAEYKKSVPPFNTTTDSILVVAPFLNSSSMVVDSSDNDTIRIKVVVNVDRTVLSQIVNGLTLPAQIKEGIFSLTDSLSKTKYVLLNKAYRKPDFKRPSEYNDFKIGAIPSLITSINGRINSKITIPFQSNTPFYNLSIMSMGVDFEFRLRIYSKTKFSVLRMKTKLYEEEVLETNTFQESLNHPDGGYYMYYSSNYVLHGTDILEKLTITVNRDGVESDVVWDPMDYFFKLYNIEPTFTE